jgi:tetrathionate reductase subunit B
MELSGSLKIRENQAVSICLAPETSSQPMKLHPAMPIYTESSIAWLKSAGGRDRTVKYAMLIDVNRCSLCYSCVVACKDEHVGNPYPPFSYPEPDKDQQWIRLIEIEKGKYPYVKVYPTPILCMHCQKAACMDVCPVKGAVYRAENGTVIIDPAICSGCKACIKACQYNAIFFNEDANIAQKCTLCAHRLEQGKELACVGACPSEVFTFGEESIILAEAKKRKAKVLNSEYRNEPRIYYVGLPSISLAGHVIDSKTLMDVAGASVTVSGGNAGKSSSSKSNISGVFLIEDLDAGKVHSIKIEYPGYSSKAIDNIMLDIEYKHLGDIKLTRT